MPQSKELHPSETLSCHAVYTAHGLLQPIICPLQYTPYMGLTVIARTSEPHTVILDSEQASLLVRAFVFDHFCILSAQGKESASSKIALSVTTLQR